MAIVHPQIGGVDFIRLDGDELDGFGDETEEISRPGVDGHAFRLMAAKVGDRRQEAVVDVTSQANAKTLVTTTYPALKGTIVTIRKKGQTYTNWLVRDARVTKIQTGTGGVGGVNGGSILVFSQWVFSYAGTPS